MNTYSRSAVHRANDVDEAAAGRADDESAGAEDEADADRADEGEGLQDQWSQDPAVRGEVYPASR